MWNSRSSHAWALDHLNLLQANAKWQTSTASWPSANCCWQQQPYVGRHFRVYRVVSQPQILWTTLEHSKAGRTICIWGNWGAEVLRWATTCPRVYTSWAGSILYNLHLRPISESKVLSISLLYASRNRGKYASLGPKLQSIALKPIHSFNEYWGSVPAWPCTGPCRDQWARCRSCSPGTQDHIARVHYARHCT